jgi:hypothetical protein
MGMMDTLQWIGESLNKPGAALRGVLGGQGAGALKHLIPFSDTMGITNPRDQMTGRQMLQNWGVLGENKSGLDWGDVAGFGADLATGLVGDYGYLKGATALGRMAGSYADNAVKGGVTLGSLGGATGDELLRMPTMYSRARQAAEALPERGVKGQSLINTMQKVAPEGVSMAEIDALGLPQLAKQAVLTPEDVIRHMDSQPPVVGLDWNRANSYQDYIARGPDNLSGWEGVGGRGATTDMNYTEALLRASKPTYADLETPGPLKNLIDVAEENKRYGNAYEDLRSAYSPFVGRHFSQPNIMTSIRHTDRMTPDGAPVLFGDEIQSDWFQTPFDDFGNPLSTLAPKNLIDPQDLQRAAPLLESIKESKAALSKAAANQYQLEDLEKLAGIDGRLADVFRGRKYYRTRDMNNLARTRMEMNSSYVDDAAAAADSFKRQIARLGEDFGDETAYHVQMALNSLASGNRAPPPAWLFDEIANAKSARESARGAFESLIPQLDSFIEDSFKATGPFRPYSPLKDEWQNLGLKYLLEEAAHKEVPYLALTRAETIQPIVGGKLSGQQAFYNKELIDRMNKILGKQLRVDERVAPLNIAGIGEQSGIRMTPELRKAILTKGMPLMSAAMAAPTLKYMMGGQDV